MLPKAELSVSEPAVVISTELVRERVFDAINLGVNEHFRLKKPTQEQVQRYVESILPDIARALGPGAVVEVDNPVLDPAQEAAKRLDGTFDLSTISFKATVQVQKPVEFITIQFTVDAKER